MLDQKKLFQDRGILKQNGFFVMCIQVTDDNGSKVSVPINTELTPTTYCVGNGIFVTDGEGVTWCKESYVNPESIGLVGYEYYSWSNVIDWSAEK